MARHEPGLVVAQTHTSAHNRMNEDMTAEFEPPGKAPRVAHVASIDLSLHLLLLHQLIAIRSAGYDVIAVSSAGVDVPFIERAGIPHHDVQFTRRLTPLRDLVTLVQLVRLFRRERPLIVHTHNPKPGLLGQLAARIAGVPFVVNTLHGFYFHDHTPPMARRFYIAMERIAALCSDVILSQNPEDIDTAVRERIAPRRKLRLLGNGIDLTRFDPARFSAADRARMRVELGVPANALVIGFVGRLVREKGLLELLEALASVRAEVPPFVCVIIGPDDAEKADAISAASAAEHGVADICRFLGRRADMPDLYAVMDVFVLPSWREGFPRAPMEAATMGVPVIATRIRGCVETVLHGQTGLLVPRRDVDALAAALRTLLCDAELRKRMGESGRDLARDRFDERRVFATVLATYEELRSRRGSRA